MWLAVWLNGNALASMLIHDKYYTNAYLSSSHGLLVNPLSAILKLQSNGPSYSIHSFIHSYSFTVQVDITQLQTDREARKEDRIIYM